MMVNGVRLVVMGCLFVFVLPAAIQAVDVDPDVEFLMRDGNKDGKVTREEFKQGKKAEATDEAFACLDADMSGYVTKEERDALRTRFWKSRLSKLNAEEVVEWVAYDKCVPTNVTNYLPRIKAGNLNGLALWDIGVKNPSLLRTELKIDMSIVRRTIVQARPLRIPTSASSLRHRPLPPPPPPPPSPLPSLPLPPQYRSLRRARC